MIITLYRNSIRLFQKEIVIMSAHAYKNKPTGANPSNPTGQNLNPTLEPQLKSDVKFEVLATPIKSPSDTKDYKVIRLSNGLTACLISDASPIENDDDDDSSDESSDSESQTSMSKSGTGSEESESEVDDVDVDDRKKTPREQKMAAAALTIGVGSFSDPEDIPGMAHFLEHMVFMGSEKFPNENDFDSFITKKGGSDNASTDCELTTFYFECLEKHLYQGLDKFAQFFVSPLMKRSSMTREREAIESEFQMALPSDVYRKEQLLLSLARKGCPVNAFTWGNLITLRDNVSDDKLYGDVHEFRKRHYSAHRMKLAIQARLPMDVLQSYVLNCFGNVPSNNLPGNDFKQYSNVFDTAEFTKIYYVQPNHNVTQVELTWALPSLLHKYRSKPHQYVSWLLGNEGTGSLLSYLRKKVWVLSMTTGNDESGNEHNSIYSLFSVTMNVTAEGLKHLYEVIELIYSYINLLKSVGPQCRIYNEIKAIEDTSFRFSVEDTAVEVVEELAENMQFYPPQDYLTGPDLFFEYDPEAIKLVLNHLMPSKMNVLVLSTTLPEDLTYTKTERWFGTKYIDQDIPAEWLQKWSQAKPLPEFTLPPPNQFLSDDFAILPEDVDHPDYPTKLIDSNLGQLWYRKDQKFKLPFAYYYVNFINPTTLVSPKSCCLMDFFILLLQMQLVEEAYPAQVAELLYSFDVNDKGVVMKVWGYNENLPKLIALITTYLLSFTDTLTEEVFNAVKARLLELFHNSLLKPTHLAKEVRLHVLIGNYHPLVDKYNEASEVTFADVRRFSKEFINNLYVKVLVQGNVKGAVAESVFNNLINGLKCEPIEADKYPQYQVFQMPKGETLCRLESFNENDSNSIVTNYYQAGVFSLKNSVIIEVLMLILEEPLFDTLRTKEQLGYHVYCSKRETYGVLGFTITVNAQATKNTTDYVNSRIEKFINQASKLLDGISSKSFDEIKRDLIKVKRITDVHLKEEVGRNWGEIVEDDYFFDREKQEIKAIEQLKIGDVKKWWRDHCSTRGGKNFRKLSVQVVGFDTVKSDSETTEQSIKEPKTKLAFKFLACEEAKADSIIQDLNEFKTPLVYYPPVKKQS